VARAPDGGLEKQVGDFVVEPGGQLFQPPMRSSMLSWSQITFGELARRFFKTVSIATVGGGALPSRTSRGLTL
jgi:hypothetical protein